MPIKVSDIRKELVFTGRMRPLATEHLDSLAGNGPIPVQVRLSNAKHRLHPKLDETELWAYDGHYPGKVFFVRNEQSVLVEWINEVKGTLPFSVVESGYVPLNASAQFPENEPGAFDGGTGQPAPVQTPCKHDPIAEALPAWTVVHLHGARVAPDSDGWTENAFLPRSVQQASQHSLYPPQARSMMLWYHDHAYTITRLNVFAGLAGGWIIRGPEEKGLHLPAGENELPLIIQDRNFETNGDYLSARLLHKAETDSSKFVPTSANPIPSDTAEFFGPFTLVNGSLWPTVDVKAQPYRLRVLNGSNARTYQLFLVDDKNQVRNDLIRQIGTDAGLLADAVGIDAVKYGTSYPDSSGKSKGIILAPAERADLIVDFQCLPGSTLRWINVAVAPYDGIPSTIDPTLQFGNLNPPQIQTIMNDRLPFPEVMQFVVEKGQQQKPLVLTSPLSGFQRWTPDSPELKGYTTRWLALNEKLKQKDLEEGYLYFNELLELPVGDPRAADFTIAFAGETAARRFLNRSVFFRSPINFYPAADKPEIWYLVNFSTDAHPIHLHLVDFQILSRQFYTVAGASDPSIVNATDPATGLFPNPSTPSLNSIVPDNNRPNDSNNPTGVDANEAGWKDTVRVNPNEIVAIAMIFTGFTGRFMYHCHILEHEDMDMMRPMTVVPAGIEAYINDMQMMADHGSTMGKMPMTTRRGS